MEKNQEQEYRRRNRSSGDYCLNTRKCTFKIIIWHKNVYILYDSVFYPSHTFSETVQMFYLSFTKYSESTQQVAFECALYLYRFKSNLVVTNLLTAPSPRQQIQLRETTKINRIYLLFILHIENTCILEGEHDTIWTQEMQLSKLFIQVFPTKQSAITYSTLYSLVQV